MSKHTTLHVACDGIADLILEFNCKEQHSLHARTRQNCLQRYSINGRPFYFLLIKFDMYYGFMCWLFTCVVLGSTFTVFMILDIEKHAYSNMGKAVYIYHLTNMLVA